MKARAVLTHAPSTSPHHHPLLFSLRRTNWHDHALQESGPLSWSSTSSMTGVTGRLAQRIEWRRLQRARFCCTQVRG